ncbi:MAG TPA: hypothetical protein VNT01_12550 [Symbiobacteriaceae bacterium]|nr:hypothetical protein [Symbiobacteriaceae bacterium]
MDKPQLLRTDCKKCGRHLADLPKGAQASCPTCGVWTKAGGGPKTEHRGDS